MRIQSGGLNTMAKKKRKTGRDQIEESYQPTGILGFAVGPMPSVKKGKKND
ncbi:MAG: hypothetical protein JW779_02220 [Candidatus Thorarchaeota archaeon]|nr:hypothetical protein [Candidatus Thorarchaeota archaeon]